MQPPSRADPESGLRNALAIAIVQQKRRQTQELHQLREKCVRVEAQLQQEQLTSTELRRAAASFAARAAAASHGAAGPWPDSMGAVKGAFVFD